MRGAVQISPSILAADFARLGDEVRALDDAGADMIHLDVMDGHFVPNISFGPDVIASIRTFTNRPLDVHLMTSPVDPLVPAFVEAGADIVTVHPEAGPHVHRTLQNIRAAGKRAGLAINPGTSSDVIDPVIDLVDLVLVMTVNPGFGGQRFIESQLAKIREIRERIDRSGYPIDLSVDGGINPGNAPCCIAAGANILVAGTSVFHGAGPDYAENINRLRTAPASDE